MRLNNPRTVRLTKNGKTYFGEDLKGKPLRVYLFPSEGEYNITITNMETGDSNSASLPSERPLYFRLKACQFMTLSNTKMGIMRIL